MNPDDFLRLLKTRRSVRDFTEQKPTHAQIERVIEAASWAPSNHNRQGWKFIVYEERQKIIELAASVRQSLKSILTETDRLMSAHSEELIHFAGVFEKAPIIILALHKKSPAVGRSIRQSAGNNLISSEAISTSMACQNLVLAAHSMGLGGCIMTAPLLAVSVWEAVDLPVGYEPTCLIAIGYPAREYEMPKRKKLEHILEYR